TRGVDPRAAPALERSRRRRVRRDLARRSARGRDALLDGPVDRHEHAVLLRAVEQPGADRARPHTGARGTDRDRGVPERLDLRAPHGGRAPCEPAALDGDAARRPLRGRRGARPPGGGPPRVLPTTPAVARPEFVCAKPVARATVCAQTKAQSVASNSW